MNVHQQCYLGGAFRPSEGNRRAELVSPTSAQVFAELVYCSRADVDRAVAAAQAALLDWARSALEDRRIVLRRLHAEVEQRKEQFAAVLAQEIGCPVWLARLMQVPMALRGIELAIAGLDDIRWTEAVGNGLVERVAVGVVAAITPWNFPVHQMVAKIVAAIAAGCTIVMKPSEVAPGVALLLAQALHASSLPAGVVNLIWGGDDIGRYLVGHPGIDHVSFTGSTVVGRQIMATAAQDLKSLTLELGGKSAAVLLDDADLDAALPNVARMCFANSGQTCVSQSRLLVPRSRVDEVVSRLESIATQWPMGEPTDVATRLGPLATGPQFERVKGMIDRAARSGARLCFGGVDAADEFGDGFFVGPTLFRDVDATMEIAREEVFGPVLSLIAYDSDDDAVAIANATAYGLSGAVWSADAQRASRFARRMKTGQVILNGAAQNLATPFGGWKRSGFGRENGRYGIEDLLVYRSLHSDAPVSAMPDAQ